MCFHLFESFVFQQSLIVISLGCDLSFQTPVLSTPLFKHKLSEEVIETLSRFSAPIHFLVVQLCPALCDPMDCSMPHFPGLHISRRVHAKSLQSCLTFCNPYGLQSARLLSHEILQPRILEWAAISSSRESFQPRELTHISYVSCIGRHVLHHQCYVGNPLFPGVCSNSCPLSRWVMPSNHLILYHPLLLPSSIFTSIKVLSNESALGITWPKHWNFSFHITPSKEYSGVISFRNDWSSLVYSNLASDFITQLNCSSLTSM